MARWLHVQPNAARGWTNLGLLKCYRMDVRADRRTTTDDIHKSLEDGGNLLQDDADDTGVIVEAPAPNPDCLTSKVPANEMAGANCSSELDYAQEKLPLGNTYHWTNIGMYAQWLVKYDQ